MNNFKWINNYIKIIITITFNHLQLKKHLQDRIIQIKSTIITNRKDLFQLEITLQKEHLIK